MLGDPASPLLWSVNGDGPDERSLPAWCAFTGQSAENASGWGWLDAIDSGDREKVRATWAQITQTQLSVTFSCQIHHIHQGYFPFKVIAVPAWNVEHQLDGWLLFFLKEPIHSSPNRASGEMKRMYSMIFAQNVLGVFSFSLDGNILQVNERFCQLTGYNEAELLTMTLWELSAPENIQAHIDALHTILATGENPQPFRTRLKCKNGTALWVRMAQFPVRQPTDEPRYFFFTAEDITEQVQAEDERAELIARSQEAHMEAMRRTLQLEAVFEAINDGILVCDPEGKIIQLNAAVRKLLHLDKHPEFLQRPFIERFASLEASDENGQLIPADQWPLTRILRGETLNTGRSDDIRLRLPDGEYIYVNHTGTTIRDQQNEILGAVIVIHDVNERHILENRIQKSFRILLALAEELVDLPERIFQHPATPGKGGQGQPPVHPFQAASDYLAELTCQMLEYRGVSISLLDPGTENLHLVAIAGFDPEERAFYQETYSSTLPADYLKESTLALLRENEVAIEDFQYHLYDPRPYKVLLAPMMIDGRLIGVLNVEKMELNASYTSDEISLVKAIAKLIVLVIERERVQREWIEAHSSELALREANRRFDEFLSIASHELRTPLAGIKGNIQLALRRLNALKSSQMPHLNALLEKLEKIQDYLSEAEHRVNVQNRMISDLLDVSRIQANKLELVLGPCDLCKVVYDAVKDQQYNVPERVITLALPDKRPITILGDADRLGQVIHNYLTNALKYSPPDRPVTTRVVKQRDEVRVSVQDQGPGLIPEEQHRVWERFYRVKGIPALGGGQSLGLGLHICRTIIEAHQGKIGLESVPGQGSTFWFTLPLFQTPPTPTEQSSNASGQQTSEAWSSRNYNL
jgi:PAS domain S-box-containing protein